MRFAAAFSGRLERLVMCAMKCGNTEGSINQYHLEISVSVSLFLLPSSFLSFFSYFECTPYLDNSYLFSSRTPEEYAPNLFPPSGGPLLVINVAPLFHASARDALTFSILAL